MERAAARLDAPLAKKAAGDVLDGGRGGLLHAEIDPLPGAVAVAREQRTHRRDRGEVSRRMVGLQAPWAHGGLSRPAVDVEHPAEGGEHGVVGVEIAIRAALSERRDRKQNQRGIGGVQRGPSKAHRVERAGRGTLDYEVGAAGEPEHQFGAARTLQIQR